jgi:antitoxin component YwqK of YwqJK toxin-antitoxin module
MNSLPSQILNVSGNIKQTFRSMKHLLHFAFVVFITSFAHGQYNHPFIKSLYNTKCCEYFERTGSADHMRFTFVDNCLKTSGVFNLAVFDSSKYFRDGMNTWYYDKSFKKIKAEIPFYLGVPYGYIKLFFSNGKIRCEGMCKTIRYFQSADSKIIYKIDKNDTSFVIYQGQQTYDSIKAISNYSFTDDIANETSFPEFDKAIIISFPFYQRQKIGTWKYYNESGTLLRKENYAMGKFIKQ